MNSEVYIAGAVAITPDSRWLIAGGELQIGPSENQTPIKLWDLKSAQPASERLVSEKGFNGYVLAPNGRWLAIEGRLHDLTSDDPATSPQLLSGVVRAISGDSRWLITTLAIDTSRQVVQVYDLAGQHPSTVVHRWEPKFSSISSVAVTTDSRWLVVGSDRGRRLRGNMAVQLWDLIADDPTSSTRVGRLEDRPHSRNSPSRRSDLRPSEIDFAEATMGPKGRWLATVSSAGRYSTFTKQTAVLWDLGIGKQAPRVFHEGHRNSNDGRAGPAIVFSPDGRWFVVIKDEDDEVWLFDLTAHDGKNSPLICTGEKGIDSLTITRDSRWLILHRRYGTSRLLDLAVADPTISPRSFHRLALSDDHRWMLGTGSQGETPRLWDLTVSPEPSSRELRGNLADGIRRFAISPDGRWLATGDNAVRLCDLAAKNADNQSPRQLIDGYGHIASLMFSPDNRWLIVGGYGILLWDLREIGEQPGDIARNHDVSPIQSDTER